MNNIKYVVYTLFSPSMCVYIFFVNLLHARDREENLKTKYNIKKEQICVKNKNVRFLSKAFQANNLLH